MLNNLFFIAEADGKINKKELDYLKTVSNIFEISQNDFQRIYELHIGSKNSDPYIILGVKRSDSDKDIRNSWIKLIKEHHPDHLVSKGMPEEFIEHANKEMSSINYAYDRIKKQRDIN